MRVEPVLGLQALRPGVAVGVCCSLRILRRARCVEDEGDVAGRRVVRRLVDRQLSQFGSDLLDQHDLDGHVHPCKLGRAFAVGNDESGAGVLGAERQVAGPQHLGAGNGDEAGLQRPEEDCMPGGRLADEHEQTVSGMEAAGTQKRRPPIRVGRDLSERAPVDDALTIDEGQRRPQRIGGERLDDVAGEIELRGNLPDAALRRRRGYPLTAEEPPHLSR